MSYTTDYLTEVRTIAEKLDPHVIERMIGILMTVRQNGGRLFFLGVGGGAANASHAVNDFRKIAGFESYTPCDNVSELTARTNDEGWESVFAKWLKVSKLKTGDCVIVFSVGGGDEERKISANLVRALDYARTIGTKILGVVGRDGGYTARVADACLVVPPINPNTVTPHTESFQSIVWHLVVSHPKMQVAGMKWESLTE